MSKLFTCPGCGKYSVVIEAIDSARELWEEYADECYHSGCNDYSKSFPIWLIDKKEKENDKNG